MEVLVRATRLALMRGQPEFNRDGTPLYDPGPTRKLADETIARFPDFAFAYVARSSLNVAVDDAGAADSDLTKAISLDPTLGEAFLMRASVRKKLGDCRTAADDLRRAKELKVTVSRDAERELMQCR